MRKTATTDECAALMDRVCRLICDRLRRTGGVLSLEGELEGLMPGKMLRTRLAGRLAEGTGAPDAATLARTCAATELVHTASLCHDDVIDNSLLRRQQPTLWCATGPSAAVLIGDLLLCEAVDLVLETAGGRYVRPFAAKVKELCAAEAEQELKLRGEALDVATCVRLARQKTGPLFAFAASVCGGDDPQLEAALEEAGYRVGTAYQLADDLIDRMGQEGVAGKTLGNDGRRRKFTLAQDGKAGLEEALDQISALCGSALELLADWPAARRALARYLADDLRPVLARFDESLAQCVSGLE